MDCKLQLVFRNMTNYGQPEVIDLAVHIPYDGQKIRQCNKVVKLQADKLHTGIVTCEITSDIVIAQP
jgi:hypothetical protein